MAEKSKKKASKKDQVKEKAQVDDQDESDIEVEDNYNLDHLTRKDKLIIMKIVEKNDELEERMRSKSNHFKSKKCFSSPSWKN
jgi:tRNA (Thr-GGU) A37 N-methylase